MTPKALREYRVAENETVATQPDGALDLAGYLSGRAQVDLSRMSPEAWGLLGKTAAASPWETLTAVAEVLRQIVGVCFNCLESTLEEIDYREGWKVCASCGAVQPQHLTDSQLERKGRAFGPLTRSAEFSSESLFFEREGISVQTASEKYAAPKKRKSSAFPSHRPLPPLPVEL